MGYGKARKEVRSGTFTFYIFYFTFSSASFQCFTINMDPIRLFNSKLKRPFNRSNAINDNIKSCGIIKLKHVNNMLRERN